MERERGGGSPKWQPAVYILRICVLLVSLMEGREYSEEKAGELR